MPSHHTRAPKAPLASDAVGPPRLHGVDDWLESRRAARLVHASQLRARLARRLRPLVGLVRLNVQKRHGVAQKVLELVRLLCLLQHLHQVVHPLLLAPLELLYAVLHLFG